MAARSIGSGTISFGLVSIPIKLFTATSPQNVSFNQLHKKCGSRLKQQLLCPVDNEVVPRTDIVKGYEYTKDRYVQFSDEELKKLEAELVSLEKQSADLTARWKSEKDKLANAQKLKTELDALRVELANAQRRGEYQKAGELAYGRIPELEKKLKDVEGKNAGAVVEEAVTADHVAQVVSRWTGIPVDRMLEGERGGADEAVARAAARQGGPDPGAARDRGHRRRRAEAGDHGEHVARRAARLRRRGAQGMEDPDARR